MSKLIVCLVANRNATVKTLISCTSAFHSKPQDCDEDEKKNNDAACNVFWNASKEKEMFTVL